MASAGTGARAGFQSRPRAGNLGARAGPLRTHHAERSRAFAAALDRLLGARNLRDIQPAALSISRSMRDEAADWYSVVHPQDVELPT